MPSQSPPAALKDALHELESSASTATVDLLSRYTRLHSRFKEQKLDLFTFLTPVARRVVTAAHLTFGHDAALVARLAGQPWQLRIPALLDIFGPAALLSRRVLQGLDAFAAAARYAGRVSWQEARDALAAAQQRRQRNPDKQQRVPRARDWTPADFKTAMDSLGLVPVKKKVPGPVDRPFLPAPPISAEPAPAPTSPTSANSTPAPAPSQLARKRRLTSIGAHAPSTPKRRRITPILEDDEEEEEDDATSVEVGRAAGEELPDLPSESDDPFGGPLSDDDDDGVGFSINSPPRQLAAKSPPPGTARSVFALAPRQGSVKDVLGDTDTAQVLDQLQDGRWLGHDTIFALLSIFDQRRVRVIETEYPRTSWDGWSQSHHYTLDPVVSTVVIPLHLADRAHWVCICIYLHEARAGFFDSLRKPAGFSSLQAAAKAVIKSVGHNWDAQWTFDEEAWGPQQTGGADCGVFVVVACLHLLVSRTVPAQMDPRIWRYLFRCAIHGDEPVERAPLLVDPAPTPGVRPAERAALLQACSNAEAACAIVASAVAATSREAARSSAPTRKLAENLAKQVEQLKGLVGEPETAQDLETARTALSRALDKVNARALSEDRRRNQATAQLSRLSVVWAAADDLHEGLRTRLQDLRKVVSSEVEALKGFLADF